MARVDILKTAVSYAKDIFLHKSEIGHEPDLYKLRRRPDKALESV